MILLDPEQDASYDIQQAARALCRLRSTRLNADEAEKLVGLVRLAELARRDALNSET